MIALQSLTTDAPVEVPQLDDMTWYSGPPPSHGWWVASGRRDRDIVRYWNGQWWSGALNYSSRPGIDTLRDRKADRCEYPPEATEWMFRRPPWLAHYPEEWVA